MTEREERLDCLRLILSSGEAGSQEEIRAQLVRHGYKMSQGTLSRDLHQLKAAKISVKGEQRYVLPGSSEYRRRFQPEVVPTFLHNTGFKSLLFAGTIAVVHTRPGYAALLSTEIDNRNLRTVAGTVAGDDTIFVALNEGVSKQAFTEELAGVIQAVKM